MRENSLVIATPIHAHKCPMGGLGYVVLEWHPPNLSGLTQMKFISAHVSAEGSAYMSTQGLRLAEALS